MADNGDPRFAAPIWEGRYEVTPAEGVTLSSTTVMLTKANQCQLCGDAEGVTAGEVFATLPPECRPGKRLQLPVCTDASGSNTVSLEGTGTVSLTSEPGSYLPILVSGEFNDSGELLTAYTLQIVNNASPLPTLTGDIEATLSGTIDTGGLATLTIETNGEMTCSSGRTIYLDGFSYHICDRWY